jgi:hypothetical protein
LVNGASQTGTTLIIDGGTGGIYKGQTFTVAGVSGTYTVLSVTSPSGTDATFGSYATTVKLTEALASSPADNAALTFSTTQVLPPHLVTKSVTLVNSSDADMKIGNSPLSSVNHGFVLVAGAGITIDVSDTGSIYVSSSAGKDLSIIGS